MSKKAKNEVGVCPHCGADRFAKMSPLYDEGCLRRALRQALDDFHGFGFQRIGSEEINCCIGASLHGEPGIAFGRGKTIEQAFASAVLDAYGCGGFGERGKGKR